MEKAVNYKKNFMIMVAVFVALNVLSGLIINGYMQRKTSKTEFISCKTSKIKHMHLNAGREFDVVYVGSSSVFYHISTEVFARNGLNIYNMGVVGSRISSHLSVIKEALKLRPRFIVISTGIHYLFKDPLVPRVGGTALLSFSDVVALFKTQKSFSKDIGYFFEYLRALHPILFYSEAINLKIQSLYQLFTPQESISANKIVSEVSLTSNQEDDNSYAADCKMFNLKTQGVRVLGKCTNGDGVIFKNKLVTDPITIPPARPLVLEELNENYLALLNYILDEISASGYTKPILVFEPPFAEQNLQVAIDFSLIQEQVNAPIIDLSQLEIANHFRIDSEHYTSEGRTFYSNIVSRKIKEYINSDIAQVGKNEHQ